MNVMDLFCGTGAFSSGFTTAQCGFNLVYAIDNNQYAADTTKANHPAVAVECGDIRLKPPSDVRALIGKATIDFIIGGPPCQGFSSLRPNRSATQEDPRNNLYQVFVQYVEFFRPKVVVMENVLGLINHNGGSTLNHLMKAFDDIGYQADWRVLNAANFGVPQKRERVIIIATSGTGVITFPMATHFSSGRTIGHRDTKRYVIPSAGCLPPVTVMDAIGDLPPITRGESQVRYTLSPQTEYQRQRRKGASKLTLHKASNHGDSMMEKIRHSGSSIESIPKHLISSGFSSSYSRITGDEPGPTITVKFQSPASSKCIHPHQDRAITPREAARIQSFDDTYRFCGPLTHVASQIGNAVPPLLARSIATAAASMVTPQIGLLDE